MDEKNGIENVVIVLDGEIEESKAFVEISKKLGYRVRKINALRFPKEILGLYSSNEICQDDEYRDIQEFLNKNNRQRIYSYLVTTVDEHRKYTKLSTISILVNSKEYASRLQRDYGAWFVKVSPSNEMAPEYDWGIDSSLDFKKQVEGLLRVLTKNIKDVKYKENE